MLNSRRRYAEFVRKSNTYSSGVVVKIEVSLSLALSWLGLTEVRVLAQVVVVQLLLEGLVGGLWYDALLFQDGQDTHGLIEQDRNLN